jgi:GntP family gluconate:H+ symporter
MATSLHNYSFVCWRHCSNYYTHCQFQVHAFFALLIACFVIGLGTQMPVADIINTIKDGFGNILKSLGLIIVLGTTLGILLEHTGSTRVMAAFILKLVGERNATWAMSLTDL